LFGAIQILKSRIKQIKLKKEQGKKVAWMFGKNIKWTEPRAE
jgi:hypothetical protein